MKRISILATVIAISMSASAQSTTWEAVYNVIQTNCSGCHVAGHESGLDLSTDATTVYSSLVDIAPTNVTSAGKGYKRVFAGDPYRSFLFSKINNSLALDVNLGAGEGTACPQGAAPLNNKDIELIRQWILYGAQESDTLVDIDLVNAFYDLDGEQSMPSPPAPPAAGTGFQIHFGPFFLWPDTENEYFTKYPVNIPTDVEINRVDTYMGPYSHHFITYKFVEPGVEASIEPGLHEGPDFFGVDLVTAHQYADSIILPPGTAFHWDYGTVLDLNSHYINYSSDKPLACEAYINVYTQPVGTAIQTMYSVLLSNQSFNIPPTGDPYSDEATAFENGHGEDELFIWGISTHTHKLGTDFDIYKRNDDHSRGEHIFDASCGATEGIPGCLDEIYDYQHPPIRYWESMLPIKWKNGIIYEATWVNNGPDYIDFGPLSTDEMMVIFYFYVDDTTGLNLPVAIPEITPQLTGIQLYPNPAHDNIFIQAETDLSKAMISICDLTGKTIQYSEPISMGQDFYQVKLADVAKGIYLLQVITPDGAMFSQKIMKE
ncbi:MAG TPA: T9SS type A sorting domain-containing protein [Chitinophagales bacterium]|nr:T9SS type A sorting domain-containing protein [Chitinophagales bacterium]HNF70258.1 T9SS type A sorting domain-containing protein [Chitinophagales bacterium]HNI52943.1 T9SS type A sorting domain-containing protein [Chitinophagales bacterium]HNJ88032.1 T9SS type A sorting domain-containing protein [Chitinophagales bacterium]HNK99389.1 T9SS type A sorting domain-containing protein [Chitinophagales bacterium]